MFTDRQNPQDFVDVVVEDAALPIGEVGDFWAAASEEGSCFSLHRVELRGVFTDRETGRLMWRFGARDAESVRMALRCYGIEYFRLRIDAVRER